MNHPFKSIFFLAAILLTGTMLRAQDQRLFLSLGYAPSMPAGSSFRDYVDKASFRGLQGSVLYDVNENFRIGVQTSYTDYYQKFGREVYKAADGADISAVLSNTLQYTPVLAKGEYSFGKARSIKPYIGLGAGVGLINYEQYYGEFVYKQLYTKMAFTGDIRVLMPFSKNKEYGFRVSTSYNFSPLNKEGIKSVSAWSAQAGVVIPLK